jgi:heme iron utilization protein
MQSKAEAYAMLKTLLTTQRLAVVATVMRGRPYTSLVAFAASEDLRRIVFCTTRATTKYRNLSENPNVSVLIDSRTHSVEDFATGAAVTAIGTAAELPKSAGGATVERFLRKHPHLEAFVGAPSTALCSVDVEQYYLVTRFQHVVVMDVTQWSSSNPSRT